MADLLKMSALQPSQAPQLPESLRLISTPLVREEWRAEMSNHPDKDFVAWLEQGLEQGFRIGFDYESMKVGSKATKNMHSAVTHPQPIDKYVQGELAAGRMIRLAESEADQQFTSAALVSSQSHIKKENGDSSLTCPPRRAAVSMTGSAQHCVRYPTPP